MRHTSFALRRPVTTLMTFAAIAMIGLVSARLLPLEQFPDVTFPFMGINVPYPGSTPEEVEELITRPIEDALATLPGIEQIDSTSSEDGARIQVQFGWGADVDAAGYEVRTKLDAIRQQLPRAANRIIMETASSADQPVLTIRLSADADLSSQYDVLDRNLRKPLERLEGVARVVLAGVEPREVRVLVDAGRVAAHGIDIRQLATLLERSNFSVSAGQLTDAGQRFSIRPIGELKSLDDIRGLVISGNVRVGDVATVELVSPELSVRRHLDGRPAVGLDIFKATQANVIDVCDRVLAVVERARSLPQMQGISIFVIDNQARAIRSSLGDLREAGLIGAALALVVLLLFLRHWPTTLIVSLAVPASLLVTLAVMYFLDLSLNVLSMMGMMLAVGMLVDNAVVITESVFRHRQLDPGDPKRATIAGVREVGVATLAGTATAVVVFVPIVFGSKTQITIFLTHVAVPIIVSMTASLVIAQTIIPMLAARSSPPPPIPAGSWLGRLQERYARALRWTLHHRGVTAVAIVAILALTAGLLVLSSSDPDRYLKIDMGAQDSGRLIVIDYHIEGTHPVDRVEAAVNTVERYLERNREKFDIESVYSRYDATSANSVIVLTPKERATLDAPQAIAAITKDMPEVIIGKPDFRFDQQGGGDRLSVQVSGESTERLAIVAADLVRVLKSVQGIEGVRSESQAGEQEVRLVIDRSRAAALGLTPRDAALAVAGALRGDRLRELRTSDREFTMRLAFRASDRQNVEDLTRLPLYLPGGERITLGSVADVELARGPRAIQRVNRLTSNVIAMNLAPGTTLDAARERIEALLKDYRMPAGYSWKFGRGVESQDEDLQMMQFNLLFAIVMIYFVMAALFESTLLPVSIITSIVMAFVGVLWFLYVTRTTMTFMALIGMQILLGVVVNIGIVLVAHINDLRATGMERLAAIEQAGRDRLRPIVMTTLTTLLGLVPLAIGDAQVAIGTAGPSYAPMARAIIGGLGFAAVTSLFVVPACYVWLDDSIAATRRFMARSRLDPAATGERGDAVARNSFSGGEP